jgi:protocatechuate 3,4-dioxygenase beta subunit
LLAACTAVEDGAAREREPIVGPCDGCEGIFEGLPEELGSTARIAPVGEPGTPLVLTGRVLGPDGAPVPGTIVYAYHTNAQGIYPRPARRDSESYLQGTLRGWARVDEAGRYRFETIRPGPYPGSKDPEHVHMHVLEPGRCTYWIDDVVFEDDPRLTPAARVEVTHGRGGSGITRPRGDGAGGLVVERDVRLGEGVPGYPPR